MSDYIFDVEGVEHSADETVEFRVRMSRQGFDRLRTVSLPVSEIWLTEQPDGTYALGVVTSQRPEALGFQARAVDRDDRKERFQS